MHPDVQALLAVQQIDAELDALDRERRALDERSVTLDAERAGAARSLEDARQRLAAEEKREREMLARVQEHRHLQEKFQSQLDGVRKQREADAAMAQVEMARRVLATEESELQGMLGRLRDLRQSVELHEMALAEVDEQQGQRRAELTAKRESIDAAARDTKARRDERARTVSGGALNKYERLRRRGQREPLVKLRDGSCGNCHVAVPLSRRYDIASGRLFDACEGCGVLLYAGE